MPRETKVERERRVAMATDDLVVKLTPSVDKEIKTIRAAVRKQKLPIAGEPRIGDLTRSQAIAHSRQFMQLAFMLSQVANDLPDTPEEKKRRKEFVPRGISI
ncbi:hypothetical protein [Bradyrhizobium sp. Bra64]|uniref:hypothetical protein n=1 Tax=Bradyrhizobium sp. Bra64 TaxID=2926009 RepID=UPI002117A9D7|nr:hypothetical protein [Bradyrhizobium sp. Bra64]